jgi:hypothetical protein
MLGLSCRKHLLQDLCELLYVLRVCCWALRQEVLLCCKHLQEGCLDQIIWI